MDDLYKFPAAFAEEPAPHALRWTATVIALATAALALLNPGAVDSWVSDLPPGPVTARLAAATGAWAEAANRAGLGAGHAELHAAWKAAERTDWSGRQPVEMADAGAPRS